MPRLRFPVLLWVSTVGLAPTGAQAMPPNPVQRTQQLPDGLQAKLWRSVPEKICANVAQ